MTSQAPKENKAFVLHGKEDTRFEERTKPTNIGPNDVIVAPKMTGLCGSDVAYLVYGKIGDFIVKEPMILGHESSGIITDIGSNVKDVKVGDRVAMEPGESCRLCHECKHGSYNRCPDMKFAATPPNSEGTLQSYYQIPSDLCYKLPDSVSLEDGALIEPLAVAVMAVQYVAQMRPNSTVVVYGAGPVGLLTMSVAKALGAKFVLAVDVQESRLIFAKEFAASDYHLSGKPHEGEDKMDYSKRQALEIQKKFNFNERGPGGVDLVIDCSGAESCIQSAVFVLKHGGTFVQVGMPHADVKFPVVDFLVKEITYKGSFRYGPGSYSTALDLVSQGKVKVNPLITHRYTFEEAKEAFQSNRDGKGKDGKALIKAIIAGPL